MTLIKDDLLKNGLFRPFKNLKTILEGLSRVGYIKFFAHLNEFYQMSKKPGGGKKSRCRKF